MNRPDSRNSLCLLSCCLAPVGVAVAILLTASAADAQSQALGVLDQVTLDYQLASRTWVARVLEATTNLFFWLALLEFVIAGLMFMLATPQAREEKAGRFLVKIMLISFVYMLITQADYWLVSLINSFSGVGEYVVGRIMSPSDIVGYGSMLAGAVMGAIDLVGMMQNMPIVFYMTVTALLVMICYIMIAVQVVLTLVQSYILVTTGVFFLAFGAFRATVSFAENYLLACVHVGIKLMLLYFVVGIGEPLTRTWITTLRSDSLLSSDVSPVMEVLSGVTIFAFIVWYIPNKIASQITNGASLGLTSAMRGNS